MFGYSVIGIGGVSIGKLEPNGPKFGGKQTFDPSSLIIQTGSLGPASRPVSLTACQLRV